MLAASGIRNLRIAQEENGDLMIFPSIEKDRTWLYSTRSRRGHCWPEGPRSSFPAFLDSSGITCYLSRAEEFHLSISESGLRVGLLELSALAF